MITLETSLIIALILGIIAFQIISTLIRKGIQETTFIKFKNIEQDISFTDKLNLIKSEIESANQKTLQKIIIESTEFYIIDAIRRSGSVSKGKVVEHFAPFLVNDILNPNEIVFMGSPIDLISFTNIDNEKELTIDFLEIKSGNATLNKKQKLIRDAINARRVYYKKVMLK